MTKLEVAANDFAFKNHSWLKDALPTLAAVESFIKGAEWRNNNLWHDAQGDDLPPIDKEVVVLCDDNHGGYKVCFGHRPNPKGWIGKPISYGKGGWNIPDVKWWLDVELPNLEE